MFSIKLPSPVFFIFPLKFLVFASLKNYRKQTLNNSLGPQNMMLKIVLMKAIRKPLARQKLISVVCRINR